MILREGRRPMRWRRESENAKLSVASEWRSDTFASVYREGRFVHLIELPDHDPASH